MTFRIFTALWPHPCLISKHFHHLEGTWYLLSIIPHYPPTNACVRKPLAMCLLSLQFNLFSVFHGDLLDMTSFIRCDGFDVCLHLSTRISFLLWLSDIMWIHTNQDQGVPGHRTPWGTKLLWCAIPSCAFAYDLCTSSVGVSSPLKFL